MSIALGSINTGLPKDIVQQILKAERIPIDRMVERKDKLNDQKNLVTELETMVSGLKTGLAQNSNARSLRELKVDTNNDIIDVSVNKNIADTGSHQFEVVQLAQRSSVISSGISDKDNTYIGVGFIQYNLPDGTTKHIYIDSDNATLSNVAKKINAANVGVRASVVHDSATPDTPYRLVMTLLESGAKNNAEFPYLYFVDGKEDLFIEQERESKDAIIKLDGFEIKVPENRITDAIPGLTINLKQARPGEEFSITVAEDSEAISIKIKELVEKINGILSFIKKQNTLDAKTDTSRTLGGDSMLQLLQSRLRRIIFTEIKTDRESLRASDIGITFTRGGTLQFDENIFNTMVSKNYSSAAQMLTGRIYEGKFQNGLIQNLIGFTDAALIIPHGIVQTRKKGLQSNMDRIDRRIEQRERMLERKERVLKNKFARLEATIAKLKTGGAGISSLGSPASLIDQLG